MRAITSRFVAVWRRNWKVHIRTWKVSFLPPLLEPIFYVVAFGVGFKLMIPAVQFQGKEISYVAFIAPALIAAGIMNSAFFETTYASFVRMYYQKTFDAIMSTPVSVEEVITGEIVWAVTRSLMTAAIMLGVLSLFGLIHWPMGIWVLPLAVLGGLGFASIGMIFTGIVANIDLFTLPTFLFVTPMFLFSGTFFPLETLPRWARQVAMMLPLTHLTIVTRELCLGSLTGWRTMMTSLVYLAVFACVGFWLSLIVMRRRLIH